MIAQEEIAPTVPIVPGFEEFPEPVVRKLDLACGQNKAEGWIGVDICATDAADIRHDLGTAPWPIESDSIDEARCILPDQPVNTPWGQVEARDVVPGMTISGRTGPVKVLATTRNHYNGKVVELTGAKGSVVVTANHPIALPTHWSKAEELRKGDVVFFYSPQVQAPNRVHGGNVLGGVGRDAARIANGSTAVGVLDSTGTEIQYDASLFFLPGQERKDAAQQHRHSLESTLDHQGSHLLPGRVGSGAHRDARRNAEGGDHFSSAAKNRQVTVRDDHLGLNLRMGGDEQRYRALPVYEPGKVGEISPGSLHKVRNYHFVGDVVNFKTDDDTYFAGNILTHNCNHFFEHLTPKERVTFMNELHRVLKPGRGCILVTPLGYDRQVQDPGHTWPPIVASSYLYYDQQWLRENKLDHYNELYGITCDFAVTPLNASVAPEFHARCDDYKLLAVQHYRNGAYDLTVQVVKR